MILIVDDVSDMILIIFLPIVSSFQSDPLVAVQADGWSVIGRHKQVSSGNVEEFLGIPYALPPIGRYRFHKPHPILLYPKHIEALKYKPCCKPLRLAVQEVKKSTNLNLILNVFPTSEDCLYLNIWTPSKNRQIPKPVMFYIHGGGYVTGCSNDVYDGTILSSFGIVVVVISYRIGSFGFLYAGTKDATGNMGLYDQILALEWVKQNIKYFGGDPKQVTICGESAGGISVGALVTSLKGKGLFKRAILQSGTPNFPFLVRSKNELIENTHLLSQYVGCNDDGGTVYDNPDLILSCLRKIPTDILSNAEYQITKTRNIFLMFTPIYDDEFLNYKTFVPFHPTHINDVEILIGITSDEIPGIYFFIFPEMFIKGNYPINYRIAIENFERYMKFDQGILNPNIFIDYYFENIPKGNKTAVTEKYNNLMKDFMFGCPAIFFADLMARRVRGCIPNVDLAYGEATLDRSNVYRWYEMFSEGREDVNDEERAGRPSTSTTDEKINEVEKMILANRRITVREVAEDLNISIGSCHSIFINDLGMRRVAAKFVPKLLNCDQKQHRMNIAK
ncbi:ACHE [Cordylochernes scorpioides]|uniref:Carboxylic ester hydrolase n=1 Tax=Cordylochernes scorpioides TaxID=51811 RepID=A0ABY6KAD3_9ARAC|nr:ACHE [Cordylochernes scorpioides]